MAEKRSKTAHRTPGQIKKHGKTYQAKPEQIAKRSARNKARRAMKKAGVDVKGKDASHKKPLSKGGTNARGNLTVQSAKKNRGHGMTKGSKANQGKR